MLSNTGWFGSRQEKRVAQERSFRSPGDPQPFEYTFEAPKAGKYALSAKVVTPSWKQNLMVSANGADPVKLELPHTVGMWETTAPVTIELKQGKNVLRFEHQTDGYAKGFSLHEFTLDPVK